MDIEEDDEAEEPAVIRGREAVEKSIRQQVFVDQFPLATAGAPINTPQHDHGSHHSAPLPSTLNHNPYAPFESEMDWEVARWAKLRGPGSTAVSELFSIPGVSAHLFMHEILLF